MPEGHHQQVALRKESVDRNSWLSLSAMPVMPSLSARRAWIEISHTGGSGLPLPVALRKESVDRNNHVKKFIAVHYMSLSARRAWIEIWENARIQPAGRVALRKESVDRNFRKSAHLCKTMRVALRKESVDRNHLLLAGWACRDCRSPQGERG